MYLKGETAWQKISIGPMVKTAIHLQKNDNAIPMKNKGNMVCWKACKFRMNGENAF